MIIEDSGEKQICLVTVLSSDVDLDPDPDPDPDPVGSGHIGPWIRIRIQRYKITDKMKGKAEFNYKKIFFFRRKLYFSSMNLKKVGADVC